MNIVTMVSFTFDPPSDAPAWGVAMVEAFKQCAGAFPGFGRGGPIIFFFRFGNLLVAKRHAAHGEAMRIARGVRGHAPPIKFFKTVHFGAF